MISNYFFQTDNWSKYQIILTDMPGVVVGLGVQAWANFHLSEETQRAGASCSPNARWFPERRVLTHWIYPKKIYRSLRP